MKRKYNPEKTNRSSLFVTFCPKKVNPFLILVVSIFFILTGLNPARGQTQIPAECTINKTLCPPPDLMPACADTLVGGIFGAYGPGLNFIFHVIQPEALVILF